MKTTTLPLKHSMNLSPVRLALLLIPLVLACFALAPTASAVMPAPDGGYPAENTAEGDNALFSLDTSQGSNNTAIGFAALYSNTTASNNTAIGASALALNTIGTSNTASGFVALGFNTTGNNNTATGFQALSNNTTGTNNTANGDNALYSNITGNNDTANGADALQDNTTGSNNTATGAGALLSNAGDSNTAMGFDALVNNTTGSSNIGIGYLAGINLTTGNANIDIGNAGVAGESKTIRIGTSPTHKKTFIAGISGTTVAGGIGVIVGSNGQLGTVVSSKRFKEAIKPMDKTSEAILALKPVTFRYKHDLDPEGIPQFGLVAEQVEKVNPDLVARDEQGKPYTVRYEAVNAMLLNEFLKEHRTVQELKSIATKQEANAAKQEATIACQQKQIEALTAGLQKVSAQLELSKSAPQTVWNKQ